MKDPLEELEDKAAELRAIVVPEDGAPLDESWAQGVTQGVKLVPVVGKPLSLFLVSLPLPLRLRVVRELRKVYTSPEAFVEKVQSTLRAEDVVTKLEGESEQAIQRAKSEREQLVARLARLEARRRLLEAEVLELGGGG